MASPAAVPVLPFDLTDLDNFARGFPHDLFLRHRQLAPVAWHPPTPHTPGGEGFWSVATHAEALAVLRDPATFSSEGGPGRLGGGTLIPDLATAGQMLNMMDEPRHGRVRRLVSGGLTPRTVARLEEELRRRTRLLLEPLDGRSECDFMGEVAAELPMQAISMLLGTPEADRHQLFEWVDVSFDFEGRRAFEQTEQVAEAQRRMRAYGERLIAEKRASPGEDMLSTVVHATLPDEDPAHLSDEELYSFFALLFAAGSDTTRNALAGGVLALIEHPDQLEALVCEPALLHTAVEEMVRWTSPAAHNRRTATRDTELAGVPIGAGDKVVFWEASANRDERVFDQPGRFLVSRDPNPHLGFGHGVHHCLGANLARLEMRVVLEEFLERFVPTGLAGPVEWTRSNKHTGLRRLPIRYRARRATPRH
jgi:cytochrome P450